MSEHPSPGLVRLGHSDAQIIAMYKRNFRKALNKLVTARRRTRILLGLLLTVTLFAALQYSDYTAYRAHYGPANCPAAQPGPSRHSSG